MDTWGERPTPISLLRSRIEDGEVLGMLAHERAAELERILASRLRHLVHEAFHVDAVLIGVDAAPGADWHMRVAHDVFDEQVRHGVAELRIAWFFPKSLQLAPI